MCIDCRDSQLKAAEIDRSAGNLYGTKPGEFHPGMIEGADEPMLATAAAPMREVPYALMMQDQANDRLSKAIEILHDRTSGLRHSGMERAEDGDRAVRDYGSETARLIGDQANRTDMAARVLEKILTEMEI